MAGTYRHISRHISFSSDPEQNALLPFQAWDRVLVFFFSQFQVHRSPPRSHHLECNFHSRCLTFLAVGLGCVSLGGPAGLLLLPGSGPGLLGRVGGEAPCAGGKVQARLGVPAAMQNHVGLLPSRSVFSVLNTQ